MLTPGNKYTQMQTEAYERIVEEMSIDNHRQHNANPDYWSVLLGPLTGEPEKWAGKTALDFGCGQGRNIENIYNIVPDMRTIDGCDISSGNILFTRRYLDSKKIPQEKSNLYVVDGVSLCGIPSETYDFVMSTIVFQHICVHEIRFALMREIHRTMKPGGIFSLQMGFGVGHKSARDYFENYYDATATNSGCDVRILNAKDPENDLTAAGFQNVNSEIRQPWDDAHSNWIFLKAIK